MANLPTSTRRGKIWDGSLRSATSHHRLLVRRNKQLQCHFRSPVTEIEATVAGRVKYDEEAVHNGLPCDLRRHGGKWKAGWTGSWVGHVSSSPILLSSPHASLVVEISAPSLPIRRLRPTRAFACAPAQRHGRECWWEWECGRCAWCVRAFARSNAGVLYCEW
jgi:hypothetical protein